MNKWFSLFLALTSFSINAQVIQNFQPRATEELLKTPKIHGSLLSQAVGTYNQNGVMKKAIFAVFAYSYEIGFDLLVIDFETGVVAYSHHISDVSGAYGMFFGYDGYLYLGTNGDLVGSGRIYRYNPQMPNLAPELKCGEYLNSDKMITNLDSASAKITDRYVWQLIQDKNDLSVYGVTSKGGRLVKYNPSKNSCENLGVVKSGEEYARNFTKWRNYLVISTGVNYSLVVYNLETRELVPFSLSKNNFENSTVGIPASLGISTDFINVYRNRSKDLDDIDNSCIYAKFKTDKNTSWFSLNLKNMTWAANSNPGNGCEEVKNYDNLIASNDNSIFRQVDNSQTDPYKKFISIPTMFASMQPVPNTISQFIIKRAGKSDLLFTQKEYSGNNITYANFMNVGQDFYFSSAVPGYIFQGNEKGALPFPVLIGGEAFSLLKSRSENDEKLYVGRYAGQYPLGFFVQKNLQLPLSPTNYVFKNIQVQYFKNNPDGSSRLVDLSRGWRPHAMIQSKNNNIYIGAQGGYGDAFGFFIKFNPKNLKSIIDPKNSSFLYYLLNNDNSEIVEIPNQSVKYLLSDTFKNEEIVIGGTMITLGAGTNPGADKAVLFTYLNKNLNFVDLDNLNGGAVKVLEVDAIAKIQDEKNQNNIFTPSKYFATVQLNTGFGILIFSLNQNGEIDRNNLKVVQVAPEGSENWVSNSIVKYSNNSFYLMSFKRIFLVQFDDQANPQISIVSGRTFARPAIGSGFSIYNDYLYYTTLSSFYRYGPLKNSAYNCFFSSSGNSNTNVLKNTKYGLADDAEACLSEKRIADLYSKTTAQENVPKMVGLYSVDKNNGSIKTMQIGNGCIIEIANCPRLKYNEVTSFLDTVDSSHVDQKACYRRAESYLNSCSLNLDEKSKLQVRVSSKFYKDGKLVGVNSK